MYKCIHALIKIKVYNRFSQVFVQRCWSLQSHPFKANINFFVVKPSSSNSICRFIFIRNFSEQRKIRDVTDNLPDQDSHSKTNKFSPKNEIVEKTIFDNDADTEETEDIKDDDADVEDSYSSTLLDYYIKKVKEDLDYMDDPDDYSDLQESNQRIFFKIIDVWLNEIGSTRRGHREFIETLLEAMPKFNVENEIGAYIKLLDCFPQGKHLDIKRSHSFKAAFQDKFSEHALGLRIIRKLALHSVPNDKVYDKIIDIFGTYSPATWKARTAVFWYPRWTTADPHPMSLSEVKKLSPTEIGFYALRQMNPGIDCHYHRFQVDKSRCDETVEANRIDSVISVQTDNQMSLLANHDPTTPVYVEGPYLTYFKARPIRYYVMRCDPKKAEIQKSKARTKLLTSKEWWVKFYGTDWKTGQKRITKSEEHFLPALKVLDVQKFKKKINEIAIVEKDTESVEGAVYAIACTDYSSQEALLTWIRGLVPSNPILCECTVLMRDEEAFLLNAPKTDPNESFYETVELPNL